MKRIHGWLILLLFLGELFALLVASTLSVSSQEHDNPGWVYIGDLPEPLASVETAVYSVPEWMSPPDSPPKTFVYFIGGKRENGEPTDNITLMELTNSDDGDEIIGLGTVRPLPTPLYGHTAVVICDRLFVIGGWDGHNWHADVWSAWIYRDGTLGFWEREIGYPYPVAFHSVAVRQDSCAKATLYVVGGQRLTPGLEAAQFESADPKLPAPDDFDPTMDMALPANTPQIYYSEYNGYDLSTWRMADHPLPIALSRHTAVIWHTSLLVFGGWGNGEVQSKVYAAEFDNNDITNWQSYEMPQPTEYHRTIVQGGQYIWISGGRNSASEYDEVIIGPGGCVNQLGYWYNRLNLPHSLYRHGAAYVRDTVPGIYLAGGIHDGKFQQDILRLTTLSDEPIKTSTDMLYLPTVCGR